MAHKQGGIQPRVSFFLLDALFTFSTQLRKGLGLWQQQHVLEPKGRDEPRGDCTYCQDDLISRDVVEVYIVGQIRSANGTVTFVVQSPLKALYAESLSNTTIRQNGSNESKHRGSNESIRGERKAQSIGGPYRKHHQ